MGLTYFTLLLAIIPILIAVQATPIEVPFQHHDGYYFNWVSTPNYPHEFTTPYNRRYVIDTRNFKEFRNPIINIYLTELHIINSEYIKFFQDGEPKSLVGLDTRVLTTFAKSVEIRVDIPDLYDNHFRSPGQFLHTFGFNISIEIVEDHVGYNGFSCSIRKCMFAGICRSSPGSKRLEFRCDCMPDYEGLACEYGPKCDPRKNISFCFNGGKCSAYGLTGKGRCDCPEGYKGSKCQLKPFGINFVSEADDCQSTYAQGNDRPCSLCSGHGTHEDWHRYLVIGNLYKSEKDYASVLNNTFHENYSINSITTTKSEAVYEVFGLMLNETMLPQESIPQGIYIYRYDFANQTTLDFNMRPEIHVNKQIPLQEGEEGFGLTCKCQVPMESKNLIAFKWFKDNILIQRSFTKRNILQSESIHSNGNGTEIWSVLMIDSTSGYDNGVFTCQATDLVRNVQECTDFHIEVMVPPQIEVLPMSATTVKDGNVVLTCTDSPESIRDESESVVQLNWYKDGNLISSMQDMSYVTESIYLQGQLLRILNAQESMTLECRAANRAGETRRSVLVNVLESRVNPSDSCGDIWENKTEFRKAWELTGIEQTAVAKCPEGFKGYAQKLCFRGEKGLGEWAPTDFSRCSHTQLAGCNFTLQSMRNGFNVKEDGLSVMPVGLDEYLEARRKNRTSLLLGEGDKFISMLTDTFDYFNQLRALHVTEGDVIGMLEVVDKFISFGNSCAHATSVLDFVGQLVQFAYKQEVNNFDGENLYLQVFPLQSSNGSYLKIEIKNSNTRMEFEHWPNGEGEGAELIFVQLKSIGNLNIDKDERISSDIISVNISEKYHFKEEESFQIEFLKNTTKKNLTCAGLNNSQWVYNSCTITVSPLTVACTCARLGIYVVLALKDDHDSQPATDALMSLPPNWIATSGCIVCLVLCLRTLTNALLNKIYCPYFITTTVGIITSTGCLLYLILTCESGVEVLYLISTLFIMSIRIWRMIYMYDMNELFYPLLERVPKWILLAGITISLILPLVTVFVFDKIYTENESVLDQASHVFLTFGILLSVSFLTIIFVYYKIFLRIPRKGNSSGHFQGDRHALNENLFNSMIHLVQVLSFFLYWNLKQNVILHYIFFICTGVLGLSWRHPYSFRAKSQESSSRTVSNTTMSTLPFVNSRSVEMREILPSVKKHSSSFNNEEDHGHETSETNVSTITNAGKESNYYDRFPMRGLTPLRGVSYIYDDFDYVLPSKPTVLQS